MVLISSPDFLPMSAIRQLNCGLNVGRGNKNYRFVEITHEISHFVCCITIPSLTWCSNTKNYFRRGPVMKMLAKPVNTNMANEELRASFGDYGLEMWPQVVAWSCGKNIGKHIDARIGNNTLCALQSWWPGLLTKACRLGKSERLIYILVSGHSRKHILTCHGAIASFLFSGVLFGVINMIDKNLCTSALTRPLILTKSQNQLAQLQLPNCKKSPPCFNLAWTHPFLYSFLGFWQINGLCCT